MPLVCATTANASPSVLRLDVYPPDAHVYLRQVGSDCAPSLCTGWCTLELPAGVYRVNAGFRHGDLTTASARLALVAGDEKNAVVHVEERTTLRYAAVGTIAAGALALVSGLVLSIARHGLETAPIDKDPVPGALAASGLGLGLLGAILGAFSTSPSVDLSVR